MMTVSQLSLTDEVQNLKKTVVHNAGTVVPWWIDGSTEPVNFLVYVFGTPQFYYS